MLVDLTLHVAKDNPLYLEATQQENQSMAMGHVGTHLDTYLKSAIPLSYFKNDGVVFDVSAFCQSRDVELSDIDSQQIPPHAFVLFHTGWMQRYGYGSKEYLHKHPRLSQELIQFLIDRKVRFIGIDCPGIRWHGEHKIADMQCEEHGVYVIENLSNVEKLPASSPVTVYVMWLDDEDLTGLRCRVLVETVG